MKGLATVWLTLIVAWSVLAFGGVYPWAYVPILIASLVLGLLCVPLILTAARNSQRGLGKGLMCSLVGVVVVIALQLVPVPQSIQQRVSPSMARVLTSYEVGYLADSHALSISTERTELGLAFAVSFIVLFVAADALFAAGEAAAVATFIFVLAVGLSIFAVAQRATFNGRIYWLWTPFNAPNPAAGPFVNRNHFAGWLLMAIPLAVGPFLRQIVSTKARSGGGWYSRLVWVSTDQASALFLRAFCIGVMALALFLTLSRSGILSLLVGITIMGAIVMRRSVSRRRLVLTLAYVIVATGLAITAAGLTTLFDRFVGLPYGDIQGRAAAWRDGLTVVRDFPWVGTGFNTFGTAMLFYQRSALESHYQEAHNDYLQLLAEGGLLLAIPTMLAIGFFARDAWRGIRDSRDSYWLRVGALCGVMGMALQEAVDFSLQMPGNAVLFVVLCAIVIHRRGPRELPLPAVGTARLAR